MFAKDDRCFRFLSHLSAVSFAPFSCPSKAEPLQRCSIINGRPRAPGWTSDHINATCLSEIDQQNSGGKRNKNRKKSLAFGLTFKRSEEKQRCSIINGRPRAPGWTSDHINATCLSEIDQQNSGGKRNKNRKKSLAFGLTFKRSEEKSPMHSGLQT
ncbi:hypothetical protein F2P81_015703 [Scophthalmus maximus]|uniref:Uncharacterized protein n=1 Tax=Scophthalmus maximus TaxID=52904 RepID=A0A6A4SFZ2_SCOMX|nr:hypothetical protein F2P81_015703 [Scophthalmus maximus]